MLQHGRVQVSRWGGDHEHLELAVSTRIKEPDELFRRRVGVDSQLCRPAASPIAGANESVDLGGGQEFSACLPDEALGRVSPARVDERGGFESVEVQLGVVEGEEGQDGVQQLVGQRLNRYSFPFHLCFVLCSSRSASECREARQEPGRPR